MRSASRRSSSRSDVIGGRRAARRAPRRAPDTPPAAAPAPEPARGAPPGCGASSTAHAGLLDQAMVAFPIGERFAAISLTAALFDARVTFIVLLAWGPRRAPTRAPGRVLRSLADDRQIDIEPTATTAYRDDGPLGRALGRRSRPRRGPRCSRWPRRCSRRSPSRATTRRTALAGARSGGSSCSAALRPGGRTRPLPLGRAAGPARSASTRRCCGSAARGDGVPAAFALIARSRSATTTSSTACATAASRRRRWVDRAGGGWDGPAARGYVLLVAGALPGGVLRARRRAGPSPSSPRASPAGLRCGRGSPPSTRTRRTRRQ